MKNKECTLIVHTAHTLEWLIEQGSITDITFDLEMIKLKDHLAEKIGWLKDEVKSYESALKRITEISSPKNVFVGREAGVSLPSGNTLL